MSAEYLYSLDACGVSIAGKPILIPQTFSISAGELVTISGPSGAGKSTLLQLLLGFIPPSVGSLCFKGKDITTLDLRWLRQHVSVVFQEPVLIGETIEDALFEPFGYKHNLSQLPELTAVQDWLERLDIKVGVKAKISSISGGEKQRVALVRAILLEREILILDEITSALDEAHRGLVYQLLNGLAKTVIAVTHDSKWIAQAPRNIVLQPVTGGEEQDGDL